MATATHDTKKSAPHKTGAPGSDPTFQSVVHGGIEAEGEAVGDLLSSVLHQLRGADRMPDGVGYIEGGSDNTGYEDSGDNTGYADNTSDVGADNASDVGADDTGYEEEGAGTGYEQENGSGDSSGVMSDILSSLNLDKGADDEPSVIILEGSGDTDDSGDAGGGSGSGGGSDGGSPSSSQSKGKHKGGKQGHHATHGKKKQHHAEGDDGYESFPTTSDAGVSPVPLVSPDESGYVPAATPEPVGVGVNLGDILTAVGETANATAAVAGAVTASKVHPIVPPPGLPVPVAPPPPPWFNEEGEESGEGFHHRMHGHAKAFAHERPVLFLLALAAALYFIFFKQDSLFETVLHTGTKSRKHDKVETFTEEVHTKREAVIGKPVFPGQPAAA